MPPASPPSWPASTTWAGSFPGTINRSDWVQIAESLKKRRPGLKTAEFPSNVVNDLAMRTDKPPFNDVRVRQAISLAIDRKGLSTPCSRGGGGQRADARRSREWALPIAQLGEGAKYYRHDPAEAKRLLAAAGYPNGFPGQRLLRHLRRTQLVDQMQLLLKHLKDVGIDAKLDQKEYGAYQATCRMGKFDSMAFGPLTPFLEPDNFLFGQYYTGEPRNRSHVNDPVLDDLLVRQRRPRPEGPARGHPSDPASPRQAAVLRARAIGHLHRRVGRRAQELRPESRLRLRRTHARCLARPVRRRVVVTPEESSC